MSRRVDFTKFLSTKPISANVPSQGNISQITPKECAASSFTPSDSPSLLLHSTMTHHNTSDISNNIQVLRCRSCQEEMSTKAALRLHTCYSIMDRAITVEGNTKRRMELVNTATEILPVATKVRKTPVIKKRLFKKPNSIMLLKEKLALSKPGPVSAAAISRPHLELTPEQEHGAGTVVVMCIRRVLVEHPEPIAWIRERHYLSLGLRDCSVKVKRLDLGLRRSRPVSGNEINHGAMVVEDSDEDSEFDVVIEKASAAVEFISENEIGIDLTISSYNSMFEVTSDRKKLHTPEDSINSISESEIICQKTNPAVLDQSVDTTDRGEDIARSVIVSNHVDKVIEEVVAWKKPDKIVSVAAQKVKPPKSKDSWLKCKLSVRFLVMRAMRKHNCAVLVKKISSEEIKKWTAKKWRREDFGSAVASYSRKEMKSSVPFSQRRQTKIVVNHFQEYRETTPPPYENDQKPDTIWEENEESEPVLDDLLPSVKYSKMKTGFKIPKCNTYDARAKDVVKTGGQVMSVKGFLATENIDTDVNVEQFMQMKEGGEEEEFGNMFDRIKMLRSREKRKTYRTDDRMEMEDMEHQDWNTVKQLTTDMERKKLAQDQFKNTVSSDPAVNLSFHGFKRKKAKFGHSQGRIAHHDSFTLVRGKMEPLVGFKMKVDMESEKVGVSESKKRIKLSDFSMVMKSLFYKKYARNLGARKVSQEEFDDFKAYLSHYKTGQEETRNFLSFYSENVVLDCGQTDEVMDIENQYSTFSNYYGQAEMTFCSVCQAKHKFCQ